MTGATCAATPAPKPPCRAGWGRNRRGRHHESSRPRPLHRASARPVSLAGGAPPRLPCRDATRSAACWRPGSSARRPGSGHPATRPVGGGVLAPGPAGEREALLRARAGLPPRRRRATGHRRQPTHRRQVAGGLRRRAGAHRGGASSTRLPHVVIEHHRRRPLMSRNSQPQDGPGHRRTRARRAASASRATASTATAKRMRRGSDAGHSRRQAPCPRRAGYRRPRPRRGRAPAPRGPRARAGDPARAPRRCRCTTSRRARAAASSSSSRTSSRRPRTTPSRRPQRASARRAEQRIVAGDSGSPAADQSTLLAKSRHSEPPQSLIVSGRDADIVCLTSCKS